MCTCACIVYVRIHVYACVYLRYCMRNETALRVNLALCFCSYFAPSLLYAMLTFSVLFSQKSDILGIGVHIGFNFYFGHTQIQLSGLWHVLLGL